MSLEQLGPYRIVRLLGRGGMGAVYEGINEETDEPAAIKILSAALAAEPDFRQRFEVEIETLRKLYHPNIVQLFGFGEQEGILFYAMELVDGCSLEEELRRGRVFEWREVAEIGIDTCRALRHAHDRGIIHRDLKPANLLWAKDGKLKLSDFGIARLFGNTGITTAGNILGTAEYMAPEQADSRPATPRTDLYSLGGVLYCLLTRRPPFRAGSLTQMLEMHRSVLPEPVRRSNPDIPAEMEQVIAKLLEKDPEKRIANATLVARRLEAMLRAMTVTPDLAEEKAIEQIQREFDVAGSVEPTAVLPPSDLLETRAATELHQPPAGPDTPTRLGEELPETKATSAFLDFDVAPAPQPAVQTPQTVPEIVSKTQATPGRFVAVAEEDLDRPEPSQPPHAALISWHTWVLVASLLAVGLSAWYLLRPPSADALYEQIAAVTVDKTVDSLWKAERQIEEFLRRYSDDSRCEQLRGYQREIELDRRDRDFERRAKGHVNLEGLLPIEKTYLEAIHYTWLDPEQGLGKLQALVDLYKDRTDLSGPAGQCLELARRHLERLRRQLAESVKESLAELEQRLERAAEVQQDNPGMARAMRQAVIELYRDKPWAAEAVRQARQALGTSSAKKKDSTKRQSNGK